MNEQSIFIAALEHEPADRAQFLDQACENNPGVRQRIERLIASHEAAVSFMNEPAGQLMKTVDQPPLEMSSAQIGPYKLLQEIGQGGMGVVYMAEQVEPVRRKVALKIIKPGMDTRQVIARFEAERQALSLMDHPNIAKVLDAGTTSAGRPYFVMELVNGRPVTQYCDEHHLTPRQRLELFVPVCQAIQHAHQKGVIHRDIKPSNVLVALYDGKPMPKVIDFGVAKAAGPALTDKTLVTGFGAVVGTLEYMSPEQAELDQLDIDTRSDIYSLGVLLYELLAGSPPFSQKELEKAGLLEMLRVIREQEPSKPSTKLSTADGLPTLAANRGTVPAKLTKLVRGELDWIVMKALEKDRKCRYETANGFAMDVQRYLADEPVQACPPSVRYRFRKFARRNKGGLAAAALVLLFLVVIGSGVGWAARDRAARLKRTGEQVNLILDEVDRLEREQKWLAALAAARRAEAVAAGGETDTAIAERVQERLKDLEFLDRLDQIRMGRSSLVDGKLDDAGADQDYAQAFRDYGVDVAAWAVEESIDRLKSRAELAIPLAAALDDWVEVQRRVSNDKTTDWKRLVAVARGIDPDPLRDRLRSNWGRPASEIQEELRRLAESIDVRYQHPATLFSLAVTLANVGHADFALRILRAAQSAYPGDFYLNFQLGRVLCTQKDHEGAIRFYTAAVSLRPNSTVALSNLGVALKHQGQLDEAIAAYRKAIELDPNAAFVHSNLGGSLTDQKKLDEAVATLRTAIKLDPKLAFAHYNLGNALHLQNKLDEAGDACRKAVALDPKNPTFYVTLGNVLGDQGKLDEAIAAYRKAIELDPKLALPHDYLGNAFRHQGKLDEAVAAYRKAIELDPKFEMAYRHLGDALGKQKKLDEAVATYREAIERDPQWPMAYRLLGHALRDQNKLDEAVAAYRKAVELEPKQAVAHNVLGFALLDQKKLDEAVAVFRKAIELDPNFALPYHDLGVALRDQKKLDEAVAAFRKVIELQPANFDSLNELVLLLRKQGKADEAIDALCKGIRLNPELWAMRSLAAHFATDAAAQGRSADTLRLLKELLTRTDGATERLRTDSVTTALCVQHFRKRGDLAACRAATAALEELNPTDSLSLYNAACCRALTAAAQAQAEVPDAAKLAKEEGDRAMAWLTKAVAAGYDIVHLCQDADLDSLRDREDFRKLLEDGVAKAPPAARAHYHILLSQWDEAAAEYAKADWSRPPDDNDFAYACLFLIRGDQEGYDRFCKGMIERGADRAYVLARTCAIARKGPVDPARALQWGDQAVANDKHPWVLHALGLAQYRAGQLDQALQSFTRANQGDWGHRNLNEFGLALVHLSQGRPDDAQRCLDKGVQWLERDGPLGPGRPAGLRPQDWLEAQLLRREAEERLAAERDALRLP